MLNLEFKITVAANGYVLDWGLPIGWHRGLDVYEDLEKVVARIRQLEAENSRLATMRDAGASEQDLSRESIAP